MCFRGGRDGELMRDRCLGIQRDHSLVVHCSVTVDVRPVLRAEYTACIYIYIYRYI